MRTPTSDQEEIKGARLTFHSKTHETIVFKILDISDPSEAGNKLRNPPEFFIVLF